MLSSIVAIRIVLQPHNNRQFAIPSYVMGGFCPAFISGPGVEARLTAGDGRQQGQSQWWRKGTNA
ncbi:MAG: hypothetical protein SF123_25805 [Chloroflexota bacterium]|nr:hypothetical protein [Chloroflexota bacterium]